MGFDTIRDLLNITDYTAKKMLKTIHIPYKYGYLSLLVLFYLFFALFLPLDNTFYYLITLLMGFIGTTILTIYLIIAIYLFDQHLELSKYYYLSLRDLFRNIKRQHEITDFNSAIEKLLLINKIGIEYSPVTIIPAYTSLLLLHDKLYMLLFLTIYMIVCSLVIREVIVRFNIHAEKESIIDKELVKITGSREREYNIISYYKINWVILSIATFSPVLVHIINKFYTHLNEHLALHRGNYEYIVKRYVVRIARINY